MPNKIITKHRNAGERADALEFVHELVCRAAYRKLPPKFSFRAFLVNRIAEIDRRITRQVNAIIHAPEFQKLEASWLGLHYLVTNTNTGPLLKLRVLNISREEMQKDVEKAVEFDQSQLFKKIYEEEYGTFGGYPYGLLVGDLEFGRHPKDLFLLEKMSNIAASAHAPFVAAASPDLFDMDSFSELHLPRNLEKVFESKEMIKWRSFRDTEDSRYAALVLPRVLMRRPYGKNNVVIDEFDFEEDMSGRDNKKYLWGNAAYALARKITDAFSENGWCAAFRGVEGGGKVDGFPLHPFECYNDHRVRKCFTEIVVTDRREKELNDLGFITLVHRKGMDYAAFFAAQTIQNPKSYSTPMANANARISATLPYILAASRFAHYLKVMMRDMVGSFSSASAVSRKLNQWITAYVLASDDASREHKAKFPLREARIDIAEIAGKPGCYNAVVFLRPHFQLEELTTAIRIVAELPQSVRG